MIDLLQLNGWLWLTWSTCWFLAAACAKKAKSKESVWQRLKHTLPTVLALVLIFKLLGRTFFKSGFGVSENVQLVGVVLTGFGLIFTLWARLNLGRNWSGIITTKENHELIRAGAYRFVRHPIYTGLVVASLGSALSAQTGDAVLGVIILFVTYYRKAKREERVLTAEFGEAYVRYQNEVPMLLPR